VAINRLAVDVFHVIGEKLGNVFISAPVQGHAQVVAIFGLELVFQILAVKQVGAEPVQVGKLLVGQLIQLAIGASGELGTDEILQVQAGVGPLFARTGHVIRQVEDLAVAVMGTDQVRVRDPAVINRLAGLHGCLQLFNHVTLLNQVMLDLDARDFAEGLGQCFGLVFVGGDGL
jgi:hypothetical protein